MRGGVPPDLLRQRFVVATSAIANTTTVGGVGRVAVAPGATRRYRVWGYSIYLASTATGVAFVRGGFATSSVLHDIHAERGGHVFYPGGMAMSTDSWIDLFDQCSVAGAQVVHTLFLTIEEV